MIFSTALRTPEIRVGLRRGTDSVFMIDVINLGAMSHDSNERNRLSIRLREYDYSQAGGYYVTLCTKDRKFLFGQVVDGEVVLNEFGKVVKFVWFDLPHHYPNIKLDAFVIMPNHIHGSVFL